MRRLLLLVVLLGSLSLLVAACGGATPATNTTPANTQEPIEREVTVERQVTVMVQGTPEVFTTIETVVEVITATPEPTEEVAAEPITFVVCMAQEPQTLLFSQSDLVTSAVLEAVQETVIDGNSYDYVPNLVEKLPSIDDGDAASEEVTVGEGDLVYDVATDSIITLTAGMTESFTLNQLEGDPLVVEAWDGSELTAVQQSATWTLVEGLAWEDGEPVTGDDSVFGWELAHDANFTGQQKYIADRTGSYTAEENTVTWVGLPGYTDSTFFINIFQPYPRHVYEGMDWLAISEDEAASRDPLSYGPYAIDEWIAGESITLSPNPNYFRGEPPLDQLIYRFVGDTNQLVAQLASGECDLGTQDAAFEGSLPLIRGFEEQGLMTVVEAVGTVYEHIDFNTQPVEGYTGAAATLTDNAGGLLFQNVEFRRAIANCIDRQAIVDQATNGGGAVQNSYTSEDHPLFPGNDAISVYEFDPAAGLERLAGLGWTDTDGDGLLDKEGQTLSFIHSTRTNPLRQQVTQIVQAQLLENCQIETEIQLVGSEFFADGPDGINFGRQFDLAEFAWLTGIEAPCNLYISAQVPNEVNGWGASNSTGFSNPEFDAACTGALQALDEEEKATLHAEAMAIWTDQLPSIPLFARAKIAVVRPNVEGVIMDPTNNSEMWNVENFTLNMDMEQ